MKYAEGIKKIKSVAYTVTELHGIDRSEHGKSGALYSVYNMTGSGSSSLKPRARRAAIRTLTSADGLFGDDTLAYVDNGRLYYGALEVSGLMLSPGDKSLFKLGSYILVFPDEVYFNTADTSDCGRMSVSFSADSARLCCVDGELNEISYTVVEKEPDGAAAGSYCAVRKTNGGLTMKRYDGSLWSECEAFTKLAAIGIGSGLRIGDAVECQGINELGSGFRVIAVSNDALYCEGVPRSEVALGGVKISRTVPIFDHCAISGGRLCGVRRGRDKTGKLVCRIYASAENDPFNFSELGGGAYADIDISGAFTGICDYLGSPIAFSESDIIESRIKNGALIATVIKSYGIESGASKSAVSSNGVLYYKSSVGICCYDGSYPECISNAICERVDISEYGTPAICANGKYYIKLTNNKSKTAIYIYDTNKRRWYTEDDPGVKMFAKRRESVYMLTEGGELLLLDSELADADELAYCSGQGYPVIEESFEWSMESADIGEDTFSSVCPVRLNVRLVKDAESEVKVGVIYDGEPSEETVIERGACGAIGVPIPLRRADAFRICISGEGECEIKGYSVEYRAGGASRAWR